MPMNKVNALPIAPQRVLVLGGTGTIGQATVRSLQRLGLSLIHI